VETGHLVDVGLMSVWLFQDHDEGSSSGWVVRGSRLGGTMPTAGQNNGIVYGVASGLLLFPS